MQGTGRCAPCLAATIRPHRYIIGEQVQGGLYSEYPPLAPSEWLNGEDLRHTFDFRGVYATLLEQWLKIDPAPIVGGAYEQLHPFKAAAVV